MKAVFLDRDGVINENRDDYVRSAEQLRLLPGAVGALRALASSPFTVAVATNQAGVGRGLFSRRTLDEIHDRLRAGVVQGGGRIDAIYACTHVATAGCACRKPRPGLLQRAAADLGVDLRSSYFVGDALTDVEAALAAGCRPVLVKTGRGAAMLRRAERPAGLTVVDDLAAAVRYILRAESTRATDAARPARSGELSDLPSLSWQAPAA